MGRARHCPRFPPLGDITEDWNLENPVSTSTLCVSGVFHNYTSAGIKTLQWTVFEPFITTLHNSLVFVEVDWIIFCRSSWELMATFRSGGEAQVEAQSWKDSHGCFFSPSVSEKAAASSGRRRERRRASPGELPVLPGEGLHRPWNAMTSSCSSARIPCKRVNPPLTRTDASPLPFPLSYPPLSRLREWTWRVEVLFHSEGREPETQTQLCASDCDRIREVVSLSWNN